jgi:hypothetical protein
LSAYLLLVLKADIPAAGPHKFVGLIAAVDNNLFKQN